MNLSLEHVRKEEKRRIIIVHFISSLSLPAAGELGEFAQQQQLEREKERGD